VFRVLCEKFDLLVHRLAGQTGNPQEKSSAGNNESLDFKRGGIFTD
jgi:hypothetical protein